MSSPIESRIATMKFDNKQFEKAASQTLSTLGQLTKAMDLGSSKKLVSSIGDIGKGLKNFDLGNVGANVDGLSARFVALSTIAVTALANITNAAINMGKNLVAQVSGINAIREGFSDYELKIGATQTIMAGTGANIQQVSKYLKELDEYADKTIYSLSDMTSNIGKFTNAGVKLPVAVNAMKGIANVAAISGASAEEAARAMYNLGQAIGNGTVKLMDWKSVELANMGTKEFKQQLIDAAVAAGTLTKASDGTVKSLKGTEVTFKNFSTTLAEGWLTSKVLTDTLGNYADETTKIGKKAYAAAQNVKTFSMMMETLKAAAGTGWTDTFEIILGNLPEATALFTGITNAIGGYISRTAHARNETLKTWKELGGRTALFAGIANIFKALGAIIKPIRDAFREIFPPATGKQLADLSKAFERFTARLIIGEETAKNLKDTFKGVFAVLKIASVIVGAAIKYVADFFTILIGGTGGGTGAFAAVLSLTGAIGRLVTAVHDWLMEGAKLQKFFDLLIDARNSVLTPMVGIISKIVQAFVALGSGNTESFFARIGDAGGIFRDLLGIINDRLGKFGDAVRTVFGNVIAYFVSLGDNVQDVGDFFQNLGMIVAGVFATIGGAISKTFASISKYVGFDIIPDKETLDTAAAGMSSVADASSRMGDMFARLGKFLAPIVSGLGEIARATKDFLVRLIDGMGGDDAIALINTTFFIAMYLAFRRFLKTLDGLFENFGELIGSVQGVFDEVTNSLKTMQQSVQAKAILNIAIAVTLLAGSLLVLSKIPKDKLLNASAAIGGLMVQLLTAMALLGKFGPAGNLSLLATSAAMILMAGAVATLAGALLLMDKVSWESMGKAGAALAGLTAAAVALGLAGPTAILGAGAMVLMSAALATLYPVLLLYSTINWDTFSKGILLAASALVILGLSLSSMGGPALLGAAALMVAAPALLVLSSALAILGNLNMKTIGKALLALGASLAILAAALTAMSGAIVGAGALLIAANALLILVPALAMLAKLDLWPAIGKLIALTAAMAALGLLGPLMMSFGLALGVVGLAMLAAGVGMLAFGTGFALLAATGTAGAAVLTAAIMSIASVIPLVMQQLALGIIAFAKVISESGPILLAAFTTLLISLLNAVIKVTPKVAQALTVLIKNGLKVIRDTFPDWVKTAFLMLNTFLKELTRNIPKIVPVVVTLVARFMRAVGDQAPKLISSAAEMILDFLHGIADAIDKYAADFRAAGLDIAMAIIDGITGGLLDKGVGMVKSAAKTLGDAIPGPIKDVLGINSPSRVAYKIALGVPEGMVNAMNDGHTMVGRSAENLGGAIIPIMQRSLSNIADTINSDFNLDPTIRPVLDLTQLQKDATRINTLINTDAIAARVSYASASAISEERESAQAEEAASATTPTEAVIKLEQNNYSPKALSEGEIYRNTKNLISLGEAAMNP